MLIVEKKKEEAHGTNGISSFGAKLEELVYKHERRVYESTSYSYRAVALEEIPRLLTRVLMPCIPFVSR